MAEEFKINQRIEYDERALDDEGSVVWVQQQSTRDPILEWKKETGEHEMLMGVKW